MTAAIKLGAYKPITPVSVKWKRSRDNYGDTVTVQVPAKARLKKQGRVSVVKTDAVITEGMPISVSLGYDGKNQLRFQGFVKRIIFSIPLGIECEGYSYQLRKLSFTKSYLTTTVKQVLSDLVSGTDILLSEKIPDIPLKNIRFKNVSGYEVLDYFKTKCLLAAYFNFNELYVGLRYADPGTRVRFRLGWNVAKDSDLKFEDKRELAQVKIVLEKSQLDGLKKYESSGPKDGKVKRLEIRHIVDSGTLKSIADDQRTKMSKSGYQGKITAFLEPVVSPGDVVVLTSNLFPERDGEYLVESVEGEFGASGGRQVIELGIQLK